MQHFFISYTKSDLDWARWIAWNLQSDGYSIEMQDWNFRVGPTVIHQIDEAIRRSQAMIAVLSPDYFKSNWCTVEWQTAFSLEVQDKGCRLLPVQVRPTELPPTMIPKARAILLDLNEADAIAQLRQVVHGPQGPPVHAPPYPSISTDKISKPLRPPGMLPAIWNVPHEQNPEFVGRDDLLRRLRASLTSQKTMNRAQALYGLGGVGKTQAAVEYAFRYAHEYNLVWWVRGEDPVTRKGDLAELANRLNFPEVSVWEQSAMIEAVRKWLSENSKWLLLLDNIPHPKDLEGLLPPRPNGHIVITSRDPNWQERAMPLKVDVFERRFSIEFLEKRILSPNDDSHGPAVVALSNEAIHSLVRELGDLPLALAQASGYMEETQLPISKYLELFRQRRSDLWGQERGPLGHQETVAITFGISVKKLPAPAASFLYFCAFLAPERIPEKLFLMADELNLNRIVKTLRQFSLIDRAHEAISVHRLVQAVCRDLLEESSMVTGNDVKKQCSSVSASHRFSAMAVRAINRSFPNNVEIRTNEWRECQELLPHAQTTTLFAEGFGIELEVTTNLLKQVGLFLNGRGEYAEAKNVFLRAIDIAIQAFGAADHKVAVLQNHLGSVLYSLGELSESRKTLLHALSTMETTFGKNHSHVARVLSTLGRVLQDDADLGDASRALRRALKIDIEVFGKSHPNVANDLNDFGLVLLKLKQDSAARDAIERALEIDESVYGRDHLQVARDLNNLGRVLVELRLFRQAIRALSRAVRILQSSLGEEHPRTRDACRNLDIAKGMNQ